MLGSNYITRIPGTAALPSGQHNSSPQFRVRDTALVCTDKKFVLDFGATDIDGDELTYSFCEGFFLFRYKGMKVYSGKKFLSESEILSKFTKIDKRFLEKYKVYKNLREKGFILKSG